MSTEEVEAKGKKFSSVKIVAVERQNLLKEVESRKSASRTSDQSLLRASILKNNTNTFEGRLIDTCYRSCGYAIGFSKPTRPHFVHKLSSAYAKTLVSMASSIFYMPFTCLLKVVLVSYLTDLIYMVLEFRSNIILQHYKMAMNSEKLDALFWQPYEDVNLPVSPSAVQPMKCLLFHNIQSKLSEMINDINLNLHAPRERFTPRRLASAYHQYQMWYSELPKMFQLQNTAMPHVIVLHMCYHHLFRPFMKLDLSDIGLYPRELLTYCATEISKLMNALRAMYGLRRTSLAVSSILLSASTVHLMNLPSQGAAVQLTQAMQDLDKIYGPTTVYDWVDRLYQIKNGLVIWGWALGNIFHNHDLRDIRRSALHRQREQAKKDNKPIAGIQKLYMMPKNGLPHYILFPHYLCE
ncbi:hypothetical protein KCU78_g6635, partial [Aureobasidium melanogenum]